jgi:poly(3-hydroxybutyrate) depolymerase
MSVVPKTGLTGAILGLSFAVPAYLSRFIKNSLVATTLIFPAFPSFAVDPPLPALKADPTKTSVSGLSSGAAMAVQYEVAFSGSTLGIGVVAGVPYDCARVSFLVGGPLACMHGPLDEAILAASSYDAAKAFELGHLIDPTKNLASHKVYLFSGTEDIVVKQTVMNAVYDFYKLAGVSQANLVYVNTFGAAHGFISPTFGNLCFVTYWPFINECMQEGKPYDQPWAILSHIYGQLGAKAASLSAKPIRFDQREFAPRDTGMDETGYIYIPSSCQNAAANTCKLHIVFHGCSQGANVKHVDDDVFTKVGYNEWADSNNIIVLYPQLSDPTMGLLTFSGLNTTLSLPACWDWVGYTGPDFQIKTGKQLSAVRKMVARLTGQ